MVPKWEVNILSITIDSILNEIVHILGEICKHHLSAKYLELIFKYNDIKYTLTQLMEMTDFIVEVAYDVIFFNPTLDIKFVHHEKDKQKSAYGDIYINNIKLETDNLMERVHPDFPIFRMVMPNNTVMTEAVKLFEAIVSHDKPDYKTGKPPFDSTLLNNKTVNEQLWIIYEYIKSKLSLPHFIYYEAMVYAFGKDIDNIQERASATTKQVVFAGVSDIITNPAKNPSMSTGLVHGYIKSAMNLLTPGNKPSEFDLLYQPISERKSTEDTLYSDLTKLMNE